MKNLFPMLLACVLCSLFVPTPNARAQGTAVTYQGRLNDAAGPTSGTYNFQFTVRDALTGGSAVGLNPLAATLEVSNGLFTATLDPGAGVFNGANRWLEIAVRTNGAASFTTLSPRQKIDAAPYALYAPNAGSALTAGSVAAVNITGTLGSAQLADAIALGTNNVNGRLDVYHTAAGTPAVTLLGSGSEIQTFGSDGSELIRLWGPTYGELLLKDSVGHQTAAQLTANGNAGGKLYLYNSNGVQRAVLSGENIGGALTLYQADGSGTGALLDGNDSIGAGQLALYQAGSQVGAILYGQDAGTGGGALSLRDTNGSVRLRAYGGPASGSLEVYGTNGTLTIDLNGQSGTVKLGSAGQFFAPGGEENLRIIRGVVSSAGAILGGQGFTVTRTAVGAYTVTFTTSFTGLPTVTTSAQSGLSRVATTTNVGTGSAQFRTFDATGTAVDVQFHFIAMGPR